MSGRHKSSRQSRDSRDSGSSREGRQSSRDREERNDNAAEYSTTPRHRGLAPVQEEVREQQGATGARRERSSADDLTVRNSSTELRNYQVSTSAGSRSRVVEYATYPSNSGPRPTGHLQGPSNGPASEPYHQVITYSSHANIDLGQSGSTTTPSAPAVRHTSTAPEHGFVSHLSHLSQEFVKLEIGEYERAVRFIHTHGAILDEPEQDFLNEAQNAIRSGSIAYAKRCIQQALLVRKYELRQDIRKRFFERIISEDEQTLKAFYLELDTVYAALRLKAIPGAATAPGPTVTEEKSASNGGRHGLRGNQTHLGDLDAGREPQPVGTGRHGGSDDSEIVRGIEEISMRDRHQAPSRPVASGRSETDPPPRHILAPMEDNKGGRARSTTGPQPARPIDYKGAQTTDKLDRRYRQRNNSKTFFTKGRVFSLLWHENSGNPNTHTTNRSGSLVNYRTAYGEIVHSHIRRMVVVTEGHGYCWCISINTYDGRGLTKPGFSKADIEAHAIAFMTGERPRMLPSEPDMPKNPIQVDPVESDRKLHIASRINFAKVYTVEHNVKVMNIGEVTKKSMPFLLEYWRRQISRAN